MSVSYNRGPLWLWPIPTQGEYLGRLEICLSFKSVCMCAFVCVGLCPSMRCNKDNLALNGTYLGDGGARYMKAL